VHLLASLNILSYKKISLSFAWSNQATFGQDSYGAYKNKSYARRKELPFHYNVHLLLFQYLYILCSYGGERYEKRDLQMRVRKRFAELQSIDEKHGRVPWHVVDASQSIEEVKEKLAGIVTDTIERVQSGESGAPLRRMFAEGNYDTTTTTAKEGDTKT
jgi:hypothetical protein